MISTNNSTHATLANTDLSLSAATYLEREKILSFFMHAPAAIAVLTGKELIFELANPQYLKLVGEKKPIDGRTLLEVLPEIEPELLAIVQNVAFKGERFVANELPVKLDWDENGKPYEKHLNFVYEPIFDAAQKPYGLMALAYDVSEQVHARRLLEKSEKQFKTYAEAMPQMAFIANAKGEITYYNQRWYEYVGAVKETEGWGWKDKPIHHPEDLQLTIDTWNQSIASGEAYEIEYRLRRHDGQYRWHLGRAVPMLDDDGAIVQWLGTNTDIHEHKLALQQKDDFLAVASHELKTPITSMKIYSELLSQMLEGSENEKANEIIDRLHSQIDRLSLLVTDLLDTSRINAGQLQFRKQDFEFNELVTEVASDVQRTCKSHTIQTHHCDATTIHADRERVGQVITNLLTNAIKYSPEATEVEAHIELTDEAITLKVTDHGVGIPQESLAHVFDRFYRVEKSEKKYPGLGLGLYISKEIIDRHNGTLQVESTPGQGSTFYFALPIRSS